MPVDVDSPEGQIVRKMVPFSTMPSNIFKVICDKLVVENAKSGAFLFKRGDTTKELIYLLKGEVSLEVDKLKMEVIKAGSESARFALAHQLPRKVNGVAKGSVQFLRLNSIYITIPEHLKKQDAAVTDSRETSAEKGQKWISTLLTTPVFSALPLAQLSKISEKIEEIAFQAGEIVVKQGNPGEYFYIIKNGECVLSHREATPEQALTTAKLKTGDCFGAEALISDAVSSDTVTALSNLCLLQINKKAFLPLIKEPLLKFVDESETQSLLDSGGILLDVRPAAKYEKSHLEQAINVPLLGLRNYIKNLAQYRPLVVISDDQQLSKAAAFLLLFYKFSAHVSKKNTELVPSELVINVRKPVIHNFAADLASEHGFTLNDELVLDDKMVIQTRSVPKHSVLPDSLAQENADLKRQLNEFKLKLENVEQEKQALSEKYQQLLKQSKSLKEAFDLLTNSGLG